MDEELDRRLVAVMFTDMVGYTTLFQADERVALNKRNRYSAAVERHHAGQACKAFAFARKRAWVGHDDALRGDLTAALDLYGRSLAAYEAIGDRAEEARILGETAWVHLRIGGAGDARRRFLTPSRPTRMWPACAASGSR